MKPTKLQNPTRRALGLAPLEPVALASAEHFRSIMLLADSADTCRVARRMARDIAHDWRLPLSASRVDDVEVAVSELTGNAAHHATPDGRLTALGGERYVVVAFRAWSWWLFVEVTDEDSTPPMLPVGDPLLPALSCTPAEDMLHESGRGLFLVQCLADAVWWSPRDAGGKSVFCRFDLNGGDGA